ncbi:HSP20 family molecular chaperone IbpA [Anoxybacillus tepidamans]|uniref:HSP20 family molecular chaperone IbpA n=1 Tax=Anoxybacteroides tepidamans TaxID=265948 RepID=A0A7W8ISK5_9BACL|nr:Hsp20/alpha crystallin family protein [Anoxybacillus tepidamans]MBB5325186.1 HSP20 family molecular chaperone IbpA [Anoxybacillus tepidamans]
MKTNPFGSFPDWTKQWEHFFNHDFWGNFQPFFQNNKKTPSISGVNIYKKDNELLIVVCLPGLESIDHVELYTYYKTLEIKATINLQFKGFELVEEGIFQGTWEKTIPLPFAVKEERVEATYHHGLLMIHLHRLIPDNRKKRIEIKKLE